MQKKYEIVIPEEYECPISKQVMIDPVILVQSGQTYEREEIQAWLEGNDTCPITNQPLNGNKAISPNITVRKMIDRFLKEYPDLWKEVYVSRTLIFQLIHALETNDINQFSFYLAKDTRLLKMNLLENKNLLLIACERAPLLMLQFVLNKLKEILWDFSCVYEEKGLSIFLIVTQRLGLEGAQVMAKALKWDTSYIQALFEAMVEECDEVTINAFLSIGAKPTRKLLNQAYESRKIDLVKKLVLSGISLQEKDLQGNDFLMQMVMQGEEEIIYFLCTQVQMGIDPNTQNSQNETPLIWAVKNGQLKIVELLVRHPEIDPNVSDSIGNTVLHYAALNQNQSLINLLLEAGASIKCQNNDQKTPIHYAGHLGKWMEQKYRKQKIESFLRPLQIKLEEQEKRIEDQLQHIEMQNQKIRILEEKEEKISSWYKRFIFFKPTVRTLQPLQNFSYSNLYGTHSYMVVLPSEQVVTASDHELLLWDLKSGHKNKLTNEKGVTRLFALSNDRILTRSGSGIIKMWSVRTGKCLQTIKVNNISCLAILSDRQIITGYYDEAQIKIWDLETGNCLKEIQMGKLDRVLSLIALPNERVIAYCREEGGKDHFSLKIWSLQTGECLQIIETGHINSSGSTSRSPIIVLPDDKIVTLLSKTNEFAVWDLNTGNCHMKWTYTQPKSMDDDYLNFNRGPSIICIDGLPDGRLVSVSQDKKGMFVKVWDTETGNCLESILLEKQYGSGSGSIYGCSVLPDGRLISLVGSTIEVWPLLSRDQTSIEVNILNQITVESEIVNETIKEFTDCKVM